ncbi:hypothetical protein EN794_022805 [Mesorhizobium sp. M00.F.Ca.ET.151.01.1.1]|nr:hypothetical protein EN842_19350 [bacterium M00.F.Ca.ET.199.01.1.1]TGT06548.1 hypothetical protein EN820_11065 [bacterium M00.F.Ca.ET.177.01.1.1]TGT62173.1 hypothetical protein EN813_018040 [Mesorhizobium sp. M00.F.Ca.ET.170.01.1.1]TGU13774.1 hypothetical protein EN806_14535 [bacterium M00.F.Ca.ET.163.01.1.1]TGU95735.1 hypothetical protein EN794_022805 [Mesorhizobium sp. M00.F.Ca.ET.151.01.1.1]TGV57489.1 hypothetical protein EN784_23605 [bacterium M00.F.Ca.ET.141.01.1.1]
MTTRITQRLRISLLGLAVLLAACADKGPPPPPEPLELSQPIAVDAPGQRVQFEFETTARNFASYRTYAVELELQHVSPSPDAASPRDLHIPLRVGLQQWSGGTWQSLASPDAYQIAQSQSGQPLPDWHRDAGLNYAQTQRGSDGAYRLHVALLPLQARRRYRVQISTVEDIAPLRGASARILIHESRPLAK